MRHLVLGTGGMAHAHAEAFGAIDGVELVACIDTDAARRVSFAETFGIPRHYGSVGEALAAGGFDSASNVTPDAVHCPTTLQLLDGGIHVFCEKPLATNSADAEKMARRATEKGLVNGLNLTYRNVSALQAARKIIADGGIGAVRHVEASYLQSWLTQDAWGDWQTEDKWLWRLSTAHGSKGALGDIGIHIVDFASFAVGEPVAGITGQTKTFPKAPDDRIGDYVLDANDAFVLTAEFSGGAVGVIHATRFATGHFNDLSLRVYGTRGGLKVSNAGDLGTLDICQGADAGTATWAPVALEPVETTYQRFARAVMTGAGMEPDFAIGAAHQQVLDAVELADLSGGRVSFS